MEKDAQPSLGWPLGSLNSNFLPLVLPGVSALELMGWQQTIPVSHGPSSYKVPDKLYIIQPCFAVMLKAKAQPNREREVGEGLDGRGGSARMILLKAK